VLTTAEKGRRYYAKHRDKVLARNNEWNRTHKEQILAYQKRYHAENARKRKNDELQKLYGMSIDDFDKLAKEQDYRCKGCNKIKKLVVDHNHVTGEVRGLLCNKCNPALGLLEDNKETLRALILHLDSKTGYGKIKEDFTKQTSNTIHDVM
jgi:hypothetical protein